MKIIDIPEVKLQYEDLKQDSEVLFTQLVGSRMFGHSSESSDYDLRIITIPHKDYFRPNRVGIVLGFDDINLLRGDQYSVISDKKQFSVKEESGFDRKYDIFKYDCILYFRMMVLEGAYYYLANAHSEEKFYIESHNEFSKYRETFINSIPDFSYLTAARVLLRDFESLTTLTVKSSVMKNELKSKRLGQYTFIKNFLLTRSLYGHGVDYVDLKNRSLTNDQILLEIDSIKKDLSKFISENFLSYRSSSEKHFKTFRGVMCKMMNDIYCEEIFPDLK